jgi:pilus assembly protein CpaE
MSRARTHVQQHPIVIISFDDDYAGRFTRELQDKYPTLHISPLIRTLKASMESLQPSIAVFDLQTIKTEDHSIFEIMKSINDDFPHVRMIALGNQNMPTQVIAAMKAGACDFVDRNASASSQDVRDVITRQMGQVRVRQNDQSSRVFALVSGRENEGENEIAANLAAHIASTRPRGDVLLLDLTLEESQLEIEFNVEVTYSVRNAIDELLRLDKPVLMEVLGQHSSGLCLLPLTTRTRRDEEISPQELATLLGALRNFFPIIVVNAGCLRDRHCRPYITPLCDKLLLVCPQMIGSVRVARDILTDYRTTSDDRGKLGLIVSKYDPAIELSAAQISTRIGIPLVAALPTAWVSVANSHNQGIPLVLSAPRNRYSRAIRDIAETLLTESTASESTKQAGVLDSVLEWFGSLKRASH